MESKTFKISNMTCSGCAGSVKRAVTELSGITSVETDLSTQEVTVKWNLPASWDLIVNKLVEVNYAPDKA